MSLHANMPNARSQLSLFVRNSQGRFEFRDSASGASHQPTWASEVYINNILAGQGTGFTRDHAREAAATAALRAHGVQVTPSSKSSQTIQAREGASNEQQPRIHYRTELNTWSQRTGHRVTFNDKAIGAEHQRQWSAVVFIDGLEAGTGLSSSRTRANEAASYWALVNYGVIPPPSP